MKDVALLKQPSFVWELEKLPGKLGVLYDDLGAGFDHLPIPAFGTPDPLYVRLFDET